jgi:hypothetical protein
MMGEISVAVNGMVVVRVTWKSMNQPAYTFIIFLLVQKCEIDLDYVENEMRHKQNYSREHINTVKPNFY